MKNLILLITLTMLSMTTLNAQNLLAKHDLPKAKESAKTSIMFEQNVKLKSVGVLPLHLDTKKAKSKKSKVKINGTRLFSNIIQGTTAGLIMGLQADFNNPNPFFQTDGNEVKIDLLRYTKIGAVMGLLGGIAATLDF